MTARPEPVTADMLAEEERQREVHVRCPACGEDSQVAELDTNYDAEALFGPPGRRWEPHLRGFRMACGCYLSSGAWRLICQGGRLGPDTPPTPFRAWFELR